VRVRGDARVKKQLDLFGEASMPTIEPHVTDDDRALAARIPSFVRFGTSSWSFPGWKGIVWSGSPSEGALAKSGLAAYARHPLFGAVGLDRSYYGPLTEEDLAGYAKLLHGTNLKVLSKVWDEITTAVYPRHPRYGARAGMTNPSFLDPSRFLDEVFEPYRRVFAEHAGPFLVELTPMPQNAMEPGALTQKIDAFMAKMPTGFRFAFELRNGELFGARWLDALRANGAAHVATYWTAMPTLRKQLEAKPFTSSFTVVRLMLPPFTRYASQKVDFAPFDKLVAPQPEMREDVVALLSAALEAGVGEAFVLVNNKAEGSAPQTVRALACERSPRKSRPSSEAVARASSTISPIVHFEVVAIRDPRAPGQELGACHPLQGHVLPLSASGRRIFLGGSSAASSRYDYTRF
jgi:uncharacterized protein YecE (DUF72 family)